MVGPSHEHRIGEAQYTGLRGRQVDGPLRRWQVRVEEAEPCVFESLPGRSRAELVPVVGRDVQRAVEPEPDSHEILRVLARRIPDHDGRAARVDGWKSERPQGQPARRDAGRRSAGYGSIARCRQEQQRIRWCVPDTKRIPHENIGVCPQDRPADGIREQDARRGDRDHGRVRLVRRGGGDDRIGARQQSVHAVAPDEPGPRVAGERERAGHRGRRGASLSQRHRYGVAGCCGTDAGE